MNGPMSHPFRLIIGSVNRQSGLLLRQFLIAVHQPLFDLNALWDEDLCHALVDDVTRALRVFDLFRLFTQAAKLQLEWCVFCVT